MVQVGTSTFPPSPLTFLARIVRPSVRHTGDACYRFRSCIDRENHGRSILGRFSFLKRAALVTTWPPSGQAAATRREQRGHARHAHDVAPSVAGEEVARDHARLVARHADAAMARDGQGWHARRHQEVVRPSTREAQFIPGLPGTSHGDGDASSGGMFSIFRDEHNVLKSRRPPRASLHVRATVPDTARVARAEQAQRGRVARGAQATL